MPDAGRLAAARAVTGLTRRELLCLPEDTIDRLVEGPVSEEVVWRVRRVRRLRRDLGLQYEAIEVIVRLLDRLDALEREVWRTRGPIS